EVAEIASKIAAETEPAATPQPGKLSPADQPSPASQGRETFVMPAAQRALADAGVDAGDVTATGPGGRLLKEDVQRHVEEAPARATAPAAPKTAGAPAMPQGSREEEVVPLTPLRKRIAERLVEAQQTAALLTTFNEIDMSAAKALRAEHKAAFEKRHGFG
ncbi:MAG: E3 binding domain-containing protein, partial [Acidobacteriota bacterium]